VIRATTREVLLDLVVRDNHHHAVTNLRADEVEVYEDGVRQSIRVFRNVQGAEQLQTERSAAQNEAAMPTDGPVASHPTALRQLNFVAVVLAQVAPLNLEFARRAVLEFLKSDTLPNTYVTIYRLNPNLQLIQPYTSDKDSLAKAVDAASKGLSAKDGLGISASVAGAAYAAVQANSAAILASPQTGPQGAAAARDAVMNPEALISKDPLWAANAASQDVSITLGNALRSQAAVEKGLRFATSLSNGMSSMDSLRELVRGQEKLPGRKVVLYLADGLSFPAGRREVVEDLISFANRTGVAFYTVDTRGLNTEDPVMQGLAAQRRTSVESSSTVVDPRLSHAEVDDIELTAVSSNQLALRELAEATGGFAVANTNEIASPMQHVMEDIRTHYELFYSPTSTNYDGRFRKIEVRLSRPKLTLQTRKGYFAVPELNGEPLQRFEAVALEAINSRPSQVEFPYQISLLRFRPKPEAVEYEIAFEVPVSGLRVVSDPKKGTAQFRVSLVALVHRSDGEIVGKLSRVLSREVANTDLAQLSNDRILYAEPMELPAGHYVVDAAVTDELAGKTAVRRVSVFVDPAKDLGLSSLQVVGRIEPLAGARDPLDPFQLANGRILPTLADSLASGKPVDVYFVIYPGKLTAGDDPGATLQVLLDGKEVNRTPLNLPKPQPDGSIPMLIRISPGPGQCDILVTAHQGPLAAESNLSVKIQ
jgi:VWFA-related protein